MRTRSGRTRVTPDPEMPHPLEAPQMSARTGGEDGVSVVGRAAAEPAHADRPLTAAAARAVLAVSLGVEPDELESLSAAGARRALARLNELVRRLADQAATDELTGALRRGAGFAAAQREIDRARRSGETMVLAAVDIDGLKQVNDTRGHLAGDELIRSVATALKTRLRSYDVIIRFGGDEFICVLGGVTREEAVGRFDAVRQTLTELLPGGSISVGLAELRGGDSIDDLIGRADAELYDGRRARGHPARA